jgi:DNA mismatch endonuclease, patch repair protein
MVHRRGLRFRVHRRPISGVRRTADIVLGPARIAAYVDGCFWHGCPDHYMKPRANAAYWLPKIDENRRRDADTDAMLAQAGWLSFRVWEHEDLSAAADRLLALVAKRTRSAGQ